MNRETVTITTTVHGRTAKGLWVGRGGPDWSRDRNCFIAFSLIRDSDTEFDDIELGDEIEIEVPRWLAEREGLGE
jgi:hypothetical protein